MFRSQTDAQLAAKHDLEPYVTANGTRLSAENYDRLPQPGGAATYTLHPRVECIPSRDYEPWLNPRNGDRAHIRRDGWTWAPRPEYARPPVNRILAAFREYRAIAVWDRTSDTAMDWRDYDKAAPRLEAKSFRLYWGVRKNATPAEVDHARKVFTRLAALA